MTVSVRATNASQIADGCNPAGRYICTQMELYVEEWRVYRGLTQEALAMLSGVDESTIIRLEKNRKGRTTTTALVAKALGITHEELFKHPPVRKRDEPTPINLRAWLNDPNAEITEGQKATDEDKAVIEAFFNRLWSGGGK